jgi:hypothetical protein
MMVGAVPMKKQKNISICLVSIISIQCVMLASVWGSCEIVSPSGEKHPFDGKSLLGLQVEKKSLTTLSKAYPELNVIEKTFKGEVQTCANCSDKYITCTKD